MSYDKTQPGSDRRIPNSNDFCIRILELMRDCDDEAVCKALRTENLFMKSLPPDYLHRFPMKEHGQRFLADSSRVIEVE
ncbi:hypothetical protein BaRGS_00015811 [Batillaria attramentaria]|uniref:Uncharacterized protein n=1 Tax=Batillaria attramentaria TaxID=370345 RepID=A0ABD0L1A4_9CAEN